MGRSRPIGNDSRRETSQPLKHLSGTGLVIVPVASSAILRKNTNMESLSGSLCKANSLLPPDELDSQGPSGRGQDASDSDTRRRKPFHIHGSSYYFSPCIASSVRVCLRRGGLGGWMR